MSKFIKIELMKIVTFYSVKSMQRKGKQPKIAADTLLCKRHFHTLKTILVGSMRLKNKIENNSTCEGAFYQSE